jgi:uncharacterized protein (DUF58 family)
MGAASFSAAARAAARLPPLLLQAQRVAATVTQGSHGRRRAGPGETFWQFRPYTPGDSLRAIDWRQTAKSDRPQVRDREWMAAQTVALWADDRPGMLWRSQPTLPHKAERAALLSLSLALLLGRGGERLGLLTLRPEEETVENVAPPSFTAGPWWSGHHAAARLAEQMALKIPGVVALDALPTAATAVLVSDFLDPLESWRHTLGRLSQRGAKGHLVQVLDPAEESFPYHGRMLFTSPDAPPGASAAPWLVPRAEDIRSAYQQRLHAHRGELRTLAQRLGWSLTVHHCDQPPHLALLALYHRLSADRQSGWQDGWQEAAR